MLEAEILEQMSAKSAAPYYSLLRSIRGSLGYYEKGAKAGPRGSGLKGKLHIYCFALNPHNYQTCLFAIELERVAIEYLGGERSTRTSPSSFARTSTCSR